jgi:hypothetical protein
MRMRPMAAMLRRTMALLVALASIGGPSLLPAQTIEVAAGDSARLVVSPGAKFAVPLRVGLGNAAPSTSPHCRQASPSRRVN